MNSVLIPSATTGFRRVRGAVGAQRGPERCPGTSNCQKIGRPSMHFVSSLPQVSQINPTWHHKHTWSLPGRTCKSVPSKVVFTSHKQAGARSFGPLRHHDTRMHKTSVSCLQPRRRLSNPVPLQQLPLFCMSTELRREPRAFCFCILTQRLLWLAVSTGPELFCLHQRKTER
jgi:hypothetical protein